LPALNLKAAPQARLSRKSVDNLPFSSHRNLPLSSVSESRPLFKTAGLKRVAAAAQTRLRFASIARRIDVISFDFRFRTCRRHLAGRLLAAVLCATALCAGARAAEAEQGNSRDLTQLGLEELMNLDVETASRFPQKRSEAPAAVTVISSADIKAYGYRTLAEILNSIRGLYTRYDTLYTYLGAFGFGRPGDYNSRILLLIDGYRANDSVYDTAPMGTDFLLDVDLIDRVEFVPGPGSAVYGSNAFFGVINVITKSARSLPGAQASVQVGDFGTTKGRLTYGRQLDNGADLLLSATGYQSAGEDVRFAGSGISNPPRSVVSGIDYDEYKSAFLKYSVDGLCLEAAYSTRKKGAAAASYALGAESLDPRAYTIDTQSFIDLKYDRNLARNLDLSARVNYGSYPYDANFPYVSPTTGQAVENKDGARAQWWGSELKLRARPFEAHKIIAGVDFRDEYRRDQFNYDQQPFVQYVDSRQHATRIGLYAQDEYTVRPGLIFNAGLRHDIEPLLGGVTSPRLALIYGPDPSRSVKLLYGSAYRAPSAWEQFASQANVQEPNLALKPERIRTAEIVLEQIVRNQLRLTASGFQYRISDLIDEVPDPSTGLLQFRNVGRVQSRGAQFEAEQAWDNGGRLRASYSYQLAEDLNARDSGADPILLDSPRHLAKLNYTSPIPVGPLRAGLEVQAMSRRRTTAGEVGGHTVTNLTVLDPALTQSLTASFSVYNLFDTSYADPASAALSNLGLDSIPQPRRSFLLKLTYTF
jgi:outer membrane receptor protein involved in Fe transport